jgi:hypothetical protein
MTEGTPMSRRKPMARRPIRDPVNDQSLECSLIPLTSDAIRAHNEGLSAARPWVHFPFRYGEEDLRDDPDDFYQ